MCLDLIIPALLHKVLRPADHLYLYHSGLSCDATQCRVWSDSPRCCSSASSGDGWAECPVTCWRHAAPARLQASPPGPQPTRGGRGRWGRSPRCRCRGGGDGVCWGGSPAPPSPPRPPRWGGQAPADATWESARHQPLIQHCNMEQVNVRLATQEENNYLYFMFIGDIFLWRLKMPDIIFLTNIFTTLVCPLSSRVWLDFNSIPDSPQSQY